MVNAGQAIGYLDLDFSGFSRGLKTAQDQLSVFTKESSTLGDKIGGLGGALKTAGSTMTKTFTLPIIGAGVAAGKMAIDTEQSMSKVNSILQLGGTEFQAYEKTLKQGASEIGLAYNQYADAAYDAISAGVEQGKVTEFLTGANKLAKGGLTDLSNATNLLTTVQNAYGLEQQDLAKVSDILIQTQNKGKVTVDELASSMGKIIPTAKSLGVGVDQLGAGYAIMTAKGIASAEATTYMNSMFNELGKSGTNADKVLREISGKSFQQLTESGKSTGDILQMLSDHAAKSGKSLSDMFGSAEAGKAALTLMSDGAEGFNGMLDTMNNSTGATDAAFKEMNSTMKEELAQSFNNMKNALSDLGTAMEPLIRFVADIITKFSSWISMTAQTNPQLLTLMTVLSGVLAAIGPLLIIIGQMAIGMGAITNVIGGLIGVFNSLILVKLKDIAMTIQIHLLYAKDAILKGISTAATWAQIAATTAWNAICAIATAVTTALGAAIAFLTSPIGLVILAIGALIAIGVLLYKNWDLIKAKCTEIWQNNIKPVIDSVMQFLSNLIKNIWNSITTFLTNIWNGIKNTATNIWNGIKTAIQTTINAIKSVIDSVFNVIKAIITAYVNAWKTVISTAWNLIKTVVSTGVNAVKNTITSVWSGLQSILTAPFTAAKRVIDNILGGISRMVSSVKNSVSNLVSKFNPFSRSSMMQEQNSQMARFSEDQQAYKQVTFDYTRARQISFSDSIAQSRSMVESLNGFAKDFKSNNKATNSSNENNMSINLNIEKVINTENKDMEQFAEELGFLIKRKTVF